MFKKIIAASQVVEIHAPIELVWRVLTDLDKYSEWNPFTPQVRTDLVVGSPVALNVVMGPYKLSRTERVCAVDPPHKVAWDTNVVADFLLYAIKEQVLVKMTENSCSFFTSDSFSGWLTPLVITLFGRHIQKGFDATALALKNRCEAMDTGEGNDLKR